MGKQRTETRVESAARQAKRNWTKVRYEALKFYGPQCACCDSLDGPFCVDHIKPVSKYPKLEFVLTNLQVLCRACNLGKLNNDEINWREARLVLRTTKNTNY